MGYWFEKGGAETDIYLHLTFLKEMLKQVDRIPILCTEINLNWKV